MRVIDQIANLILDDPFITAGQIARKLGYAEEKTVYYWLHKAHFSGLKAFKKAVLHGQYQPHSERAEENPARYGRLPIADQWTSEGKPIFNGDTLAVPTGTTAELIWRYSGPALASILPHDFLVLTSLDSVHTGPWIVGLTRGAVALRLFVSLGSSHTVIEPLTMQKDGQCHPLYQILQVIRYL